MRLTPGGTLLHRQLFVLLREQIVSGRLRPGDQLPTQEQLCRLYAVSRITVRRALSDLMAEGLIRKRQGLGAFVTEKAALARRIPRIGFEDEVKQVLEETQVRVLSVMRRPCSATAAAALGISESEEALHVLRVRSRKRVPLMYLDSWIPLHSAGRVTKDALRSAPLYLLVAGSTENIGRIAQQVSASLADPIIASALKVEVNSAVLRVDRVVHRSDGTPIQFLSVWATPERSRLVMELSVTELSGLHGAQLLHDVGRPS